MWNKQFCVFYGAYYTWAGKVLLNNFLVKIYLKHCKLAFQRKAESKGQRVGRQTIRAAEPQHSSRKLRFTKDWFWPLHWKLMFGERSKYSTCFDFSQDLGMRQWISMILLERNLPGLGFRRYRLDAKLVFISCVTLRMPLNSAEVWKVGQWGAEMDVWVVVGSGKGRIFERRGKTKAVFYNIGH